MNAMKKFGEYDPKDMPPFMKPVVNLVSRVQTFLNRLKSDVLVFFNVSNLKKRIFNFKMDH